MREMKDSGVEWIGKIPKDWEIVPLTKQLDSIVDYRGKTPEKTEEGTFLVTAKNIKDGKICYELSKEYVREADYEEIMHRGIPQIGDILFTTEAPLGQVANVDRTDIALAQRIIKFRALSTVNNYYLKYWMLNEGFQQFLHSLSTGSTATGIKSSKLFLLPLVRPNIEQQNKIVEYLDAKTWVLAYVNADGDKKYRFVVMSRNLTFDRSWDISFAMDSSKNVRQKKKTQPICDFLDYLVMNVHNTSNNAGKKRNLIRGLCADIKDVSFSLDSKIFGEDFEVLPLGIGKNAYRMQEDILFCKERGNANSTFNELVVMSPFLSESVIADFNLTDRALSDCKRTLVTRRSELGKLKASDVDNFTIYALKDEIIDGEEEISDELADKKKQDIHAKIYLRRKYSDVDL